MSSHAVKRPLPQYRSCPSSRRLPIDRESTVTVLPDGIPTSAMWDTLFGVLFDNRQQWTRYLIPGIVLYMLSVAVLRHQRARSLPKQFKLTTRESFSRMTVDDAQAILKDLTELEFPKLMGFSVIFALFKV